MNTSKDSRDKAARYVFSVANKEIAGLEARIAALESENAKLRTLFAYDQRIRSWYAIFDLCVSLGMSLEGKTGEQAVLDFIREIHVKAAALLAQDPDEVPARISAD